MTESAVLIPESAVDGHETMEVGGHRANGPSRGQPLARGVVMADRTLPEHVIGPLGSAVREHPNGCGFQHGWQVQCRCGWKVMTFSHTRIADVNRTAIDHVCGVLVADQATGFLPKPVVLEAT